jgi:hypothetical protein
MEVNNGRILKVRMGINPNSSGHGILFGSMFFLPYSIAGSFLAAIGSTWLDEALKRYNMSDQFPRTGTADEPWPEAVIGAANATDAKSPAEVVSGRAERTAPIFFGLAWAGFSAAWSVFLTTQITSIPLWVVVSCLLTFPVIFLAYRKRHNRMLATVAARSAKLSLVGLGVGALVLLVEILSGDYRFDPLVIGFGVCYGYLSLMALCLTAWTSLLSGIVDRSRITLAAIVYVFGGFLLVFPIPPLTTQGYNPVGLFFPLWGWLLPTVITCIALYRIGDEFAGNQ